MARKRNPENKGLPARWRFTRNAYYYQVPPDMEHFWDGKKTFKLGDTLPSAYRIWADRIGRNEKLRTIGELLDRYALEVIPLKAPKTRIEQARLIPRLRKVFGEMPITSLEPKHVYGYVSKRTAKVASHREISVLSHAYTKAVEWGFLNRHPFKGEVRLEGEKPRTRYVTDEETGFCLSLKAVRKRGSVLAIQAYIRLKLLTGLRRGDLLRLKISDLREDGIYVTTSKTGKPIIYEWTDALHEAVDLAMATRPTPVSDFLFCTKRGTCYLNERTGTASGWAAMWNRFMARVIKETGLKERFTEHDLRAKVASDAPTLEQARALLAHADSRITQRVYRRRPEKVMPAK